MGSAAYLTVEEEAISLDDWMEFCKERGIIHSPQTVGGNVFSLGSGSDEVQITFGHPANASGGGFRPEAMEVTFSSYLGGNTGGVATLAAAAWAKFGGKLSADDEVKGWFIRSLMDPQGYPRQDTYGPRSWEAGYEAGFEAGYEPDPGTTILGPFKITSD